MILIYAADLTERLKYILNEVFINRLGIEFKHTQSLDYFNKSQTQKINYSSTVIEECINIPASKLLYEEDVFVQNTDVKKDARWQYIFFMEPYIDTPDFKVNTQCLPFDLLACMFYLLSRYEEFLPSLKDEHNRYKETNSLAYKNGFLEVPLIDCWILLFKEELLKQYPAMQFKERIYKQVNTIDIDFAYKYKGLSKSRLGLKALGSLLRGNWDNQVFKSETDAYDTYAYMKEQAGSKKIETLFFILMADYGGFDKGHPYDSPEFIALVKNLSGQFTCGIHPSYKSAGSDKALDNELQLFAELTGYHAEISRNHFLKIKLPGSYEQLCEQHIHTDYSLGYANHTGFRASTSIPFLFFNLLTNQPLPLWVQPLCIMDVTLKNAMQLNTDAAIKKIQALKNEVKKTGGVFVSVWHNSSFDEAEGWAGWDKVYQSLFV